MLYRCSLRTAPATRKQNAKQAPLKLPEPVEARHSAVSVTAPPSRRPPFLGRCRELASTHRRWRRRWARWPPPAWPRSRPPLRSPVISASDDAERLYQGGAPVGDGCVRRRLPGGRSCSRRRAFRTRGARKRALIRTPARYAIKKERFFGLFDGIRWVAKIPLFASRISFSHPRFRAYFARVHGKWFESFCVIGCKMWQNHK